MERRQLSPIEIIEKIRKNKFKIGVQSDIEEIKQDLDRALEELSRDLYAKETHFVLELVQNADDNKYDLPKSKSPSLKFFIDSEKIVVQNNEIGFSEEDVKRLCAIGNSKKSKQQGYIGEKGIGFKSVFRISDEPHIFSNGFRFKFKRKDDEIKLGYIVPYWIENVPEFVDEKLTNIVLPLNQESKEHLSKFNEIEPELILFLQKLNTIEVHNLKESTVTKSFKRVKDGMVKIEHSKGIDYYKLISQDLPVSKRIIEEKRRVSETNLALAFPLTSNGSAEINKECKVFAYLPTRAYGFKFVIQADFLLTANREDIHKDKGWNKWLRDSIPGVFLQAVDEFKKDKKIKSTFYNYIPLKREVPDDFFSEVVNQLYVGLQSHECILTESENWVVPLNAFKASNEIRSLIPNDDLAQLLSKEYLSINVEHNVSKQILSMLGVKEFSFSDLINCLQNTEWLMKKNDKWLSELYLYLKSLSLAPKDLEKLRSLKIIRRDNNELISPSEQTVFFPLGKKCDYGFEHELRIIKRETYELLKKEKESLINFLKKLGVRDANPYEIIEDILSNYENTDEETNWQSKDDEVLLGYIYYFKDHLDEYKKESNKRLNPQGWTYNDPLERLKEAIWIRSDSPDKDYYKPSNLYLSRTYSTPYNLEKLFSGIEDIHYVHKEYLKHTVSNQLSMRFVSEEDKVNHKKEKEKAGKEWRQFFKEIGVNLIPKVVERNKEKIDYDSRYYTRRTTVVEYSCPEICKIVDQKDIKKNEILGRILDDNWNSFKKYIIWNDRKFYRNWYSSPQEADWFQSLKTTNWVPTNRGQVIKPSLVWLNKPEIRDILGATVSYSTISFKNEEFIKAIEIQSEISVRSVIHLLSNLVQKESNSKPKFLKLYTFLSDNYKGNEELIRISFSTKELLYVPDFSKKFITSQQVIWKNSHEVFGDAKGYLDKHYPNLKSFFVDQLGINETPTPEDYADALRILMKKYEIQDEDEKKILTIYKELNRSLSSEDELESFIEEEWWEDFISENIFWTDKSEFMWNENDIFVNDNVSLYKLFQGSDEVAFLNLPDNFHPKIQYFISAAKVPYLSKSVSTNLSRIDGKSFDLELTQQVQHIFPYILRYLYKEENDIYENLKKEGILARFTKLQCYRVENLFVEYKLNQLLASVIENIYLDTNNLYLKAEGSEDLDDLAFELSKIFESPKGLDDFLSNLFNKRTEDTIEKFLTKKGIQDLPPDEREQFSDSVTKLDIPQYEEQIETEGSQDLVIETLLGLESEETSEDEDSVLETIDAQTTSSTLGSRFPSPQSSKGNQRQEIDWKPEYNPEDAKIHLREPKTPDVKHPKINQNENHHPIKPPMPLEEKGRKIKNELSHDAKQDIGKLGEQSVYLRLKENFLEKYSEGKFEETDYGFSIVKGDEKLVEVHWLNKIIDTGKGYDIEVIELNESTFIEVKSTNTDSKELIVISGNQWKFAASKQDSYYIYRVYSVGSDQIRIDPFRNPVKLFHEGRLTIEGLSIHL
jgi:hypothetical protein